MKYRLLIFSILCLLMVVSMDVMASPPPLDDDPGTPIDGGASLLVGAAAVYAAKKVRDKRREAKEK